MARIPKSKSRKVNAFVEAALRYRVFHDKLKRMALNETEAAEAVQMMRRVGRWRRAEEPDA